MNTQKNGLLKMNMSSIPKSPYCRFVKICLKAKRIIKPCKRAGVKDCSFYHEERDSISYANRRR